MYVFDPTIATKYGLDAAVLIQNFKFWIERNRANRKHHHDGRWWTYNSIAAFKELFPFWSERQINYLLSKLIKDKVIITGNYNKVQFDRTLWYAFVNEDDFLVPLAAPPILQNCKMDSTNSLNGFDEIVRPIPDVKPDEKPDDKKSNQFAGNPDFGTVDTPEILGQHESDKTPYQDMLDYYHHAMRTSTCYNLVNDTLKHNMAVAWVDLFESNMDNYRSYIDYVASCPFLTGRDRKPNQKPFNANLEWLLVPKNKDKVLSGFYQPKDSSRAIPEFKTKSSSVVEGWSVSVVDSDVKKPF